MSQSNKNKKETKILSSLRFYSFKGDIKKIKIKDGKMFKPKQKNKSKKI